MDHSNPDTRHSHHDLSIRVGLADQTGTETNGGGQVTANRLTTRAYCHLHNLCYLCWPARVPAVINEPPEVPLCQECYEKWWTEEG